MLRDRARGNRIGGSRETGEGEERWGWGAERRGKGRFWFGFTGALRTTEGGGGLLRARAALVSVRPAWDFVSLFGFGAFEDGRLLWPEAGTAETWRPAVFGVAVLGRPVARDVGQ